MTEIELSNGYIVRCQPVPPYAVQDVYIEFPDPALPKVEIKSAAGSAEQVTPLPGTPEFAEYQEAVVRTRKLRQVALLDFHLDYGIVEWKAPDSDEWEDMPPEDWTLPAVMIRRGVETAKDPTKRRVQYIRHFLIRTASDAEKIDRVIMESPLLSDEEVEAALGPFD